jgi:hypothetical protein
MTVPAVLLAACLAGLSMPPASIEPALPQPEESAPWTAAQLSVTNTTDGPIREIRIDSPAGGPTMARSVYIPPAQTATVGISLMALSPRQHYTLTTFDETGRLTGRTPVTVHWPTGLLDGEAFLDATLVEKISPDQLSWPGRLKRRSVAGLAIYGLVLLGVLLIPRPAVRVTALVACILLGCIASAWLVGSKSSANPLARLGGLHTIFSDERTRIIATGRSVQHQPLDLPPTGWPLYANPGQLKRDKTLFRDGVPCLTLQPGQWQGFALPDR